MRKAREHDLHKVYTLLSNSTLNSAPLPFESRKRMFRPVWGGDEGYYGYVLEDGDEVVGFLGLMFTEREIGGERHRFCEIHSWYVKDEYRNESMKLFLPAMSMRKVTLVNYTPTRTVYDISKKFGFSDLETRLLLFLPVPSGRTLSRRWVVERRKHAILPYLGQQDRTILLEHDDIDCMHFLARARDGGDYCYIILKRMWLRPYLPFGRIIYASDPKVLLEAVDRLKMYWLLRFGLPFVVIDHDEVEVEARLPFTKSMPREVPSLYKSKDLKAEDIKPPLRTLPLLIGYRLH